MKIFITGATGFLGRYLIKELAPICSKIYVLGRNSSSIIFNEYSNVLMIKGDITDIDIIDDSEVLKKLIEEVDIVIHAAALYNIEASYSDCYMQNVVGTQNLLRLIKKFNKLKCLYYVSTIAVADEKSFFLEEDSLPLGPTFSNYYSETKYLAEKIVRQDAGIQAIRIIRPGIIVGDSNSGEIAKRDGPYYFIDLLLRNEKILKKISFIPLSFNPKTKIPMIPVDHCAKFFALLIKRDDFSKTTKTYHLISSEIPTINDFLEDSCQSLGIRTRFLAVANNIFHENILKILGMPKELIPFMFSKLSYDKSRTKEELPELAESRYHTYKHKVFGNFIS
jgi:nucleoside-diphosphate-sugar epimerase